MPATYLVFLKKNASGEEFVAPVTAENRDAALAQIASHYASPLYTVQTCYAKAEMERILTDIERWPGVASKVQTTAGAASLKNVRGFAGYVPPITREQPKPMQTLAQIQAAIQTQNPTGATIRKMAEPAAPKAQPAVPLQGPTTLAEAMATLRGKAAPAALKTTTVAVTPGRGKKQPSSTLSAPSMTTPAPQGKSVIEVLRALRGA